MVVSANFTKVFEQWMTLQSCESWAEHTVADVQSLILITWGLPVRKSLIQEHIEVDNTMLWSFSGSLSRITVLKAAEVNDAIRWLQLQVTPGWCYWDCILCALVPCIGELMALNTSRDDVLEVLHNYWGQCNSAVITLQVAADFLDTEAIMKDLGQTATWCDRLKLSETPPEKLQIGQQISHFTVWSDTLSGLAALLVLAFLSVELTWRGNYCSSSSER